MPHISLTLRFLLLTGWLSLYCLSAGAQGIQIQQYGKNVIQYKEFEWYSYSSDNFDIYFYTGGRELARYAMVQGEKYLKEMENRMDYPLGSRLTFIIYNSYTDFRQSNFRVADEQTSYNTGGRTRIQENKSFIYFDGTHKDFDVQIKSAIATNLINDILYGGSLQERLQNNVLLNVPTWYVNGLVAYLSNDWSAYNENQLKAGILSRRFKKFKKLTDQETSLIGYSLWKYLEQKNGEAALANIIYIMRANKSVESAYLFVLGKTFAEVYDEWFQFQYNKYSTPFGSQPSGPQVEHLKRLFRKGRVTSWDISFKGDYAAAVVNDMGRSKVWIVNLQTGSKKIIFRRGYRYNDIDYDYDYPLIGWNTRQNVLTVVYENKSEPVFFSYDVDTKKKTEPQIIPRIDRVLSFDYSENGHSAVMSYVHSGQTDIMVFDFRGLSQRPLTNDIYDDIEPHFVRGGRGVVFTSDRPDAQLQKANTNTDYSFNNNYDVFYLPEYTENRKLHRLSLTAANETNPSAYDTTFFSYLTDENGIVNRNAVRLDSIFQYIRTVASYRDTAVKKNDTFYFYTMNRSAVQLPNKVKNDSNLLTIDTAMVYRDTLYVYPLTNYNSNILDYKVKTRQNALYEIFNIQKGYELYRVPLPTQITSHTAPRPDAPGQIRPRQQPEASQGGVHVDKNNPYGNVARDTTNAPKQKDTTAGSWSGNYYFQSDFPLPTGKIAAGGQGASAEGEGTGVDHTHHNRFAAANLYMLTFKPDYLVTQLDNSIMGTPYIPIDNNDNSIYNPVINGMVKFGITDLFKDYRIIGGFRILASLRGMEYFMTYDNMRTRLDKRISFYRRGEMKNIPQDPTGSSVDRYYRQTTNELRGELRWPFSETFSVRGSMFGRLDKTVWLSSDTSTLRKATINNYWSGARTELVFDNSIPRAMNIFNGSRMKVYTDFFYSLNKKNTMLTAIGADLRHYTRITRWIIWANRFSGATSLGKARVVYILGGVDNWLFPDYNTQNAFDPAQNYVYKTQATNMRGFIQNARNGNSYGVINSELRIPVLKSIFNRPIRNQFFDNLQLVGFTDVGTAWSGLDPFSTANAYNKITYTGGSLGNPIIVTVSSLRNPVVVGYGFGFRSVLLGYFMRLDYSWGIDDGEQQPRVVYFSLGMDF